MIVIPAKKEFAPILKSAVNGTGYKKDLKRLIGNDSLDTKINFLNNLIESNESLPHGDIEELVLMLTKRMLDVSSSINDNIKEHKDTSIGIWRTIYECSVIFRVWSQTVTRNNNIEQFQKIGKRFRDYGMIEEYNAFGYNKPPEIMALMREYNELPKSEILQNEYDWLNPTFSESSLKHMSNKYHPSFRDLVSRTSETNLDLSSLLDKYKLASNVLHMSYVSPIIINSISEEEIHKMTNIVIRTFVVDLLSLIESLYKPGDKSIKDIQMVAKVMRLEINLKW